MNLQVVSVYRPCNSTGPTSVAGQHRILMLEEGIDEDPINVFLQDLKIEVT